MPSPFPGMDPYLEGSAWMSLHTQFAAEIARQLAARLHPRYVSRTPRRHVRVKVELGRPSPVSRVPVGAAPVRPVPPQLPMMVPKVVPHACVEVRAAASRELVTAIEVLSPISKRAGRAEYLRRRRRLLHGPAHVIEIDLLREGKRLPVHGPLPPAPYFVFLSRAAHRPVTEIWPVSLHQPLPTVPVPLSADGGDVPLDLQAAFTRLYDEFAHDAELDYAQPPEVPLPPEDAKCAQERLRSWQRPAQ